MSYSPTTTHGGEASSPPEVGTPNTYYSPEITRNAGGNARAVHRSSVAAGKQPVAPVVVSSEQATSLKPVSRSQAKFLNEVEREHDDFISRYLSVLQYPDGTVAGSDQEVELQNVQARMKEYLTFSSSVPLYSRGVHLRFDNLRDSCEAKYLLECLGYLVEYITPYEFAVAKSQDTATVSDYEGQVNFPISIEPIANFHRKGLNEVAGLVHEFASFYGVVRDVEHAATDDKDGIIRFRVEFMSIDAANRAIQGIKECPVYGGDIDAGQWTWRTCAPTPWIGPPRNDSPQSKTPRKDDQGRLVGFLHQPARIPNDHFLRHPADQHNKVQRERIEAGTDVRTTVMLRNIPNKMDWLSLKALLDKACFGCYDFVYLRIDFKSACNVGYAFINFTDMQGMLRMVDELEHRTWHGYRSAKAAEVSYATIQGKEALVQKFRNSSVMQETPFCRPRLFFSKDDVVTPANIRAIGTQLDFPRPDNPAKLQRSMDSARTVGLYPPHGAGATNDHRNRASAYDRGTPRDLVQSAAAMSSPQYGSPFSYQHVPGHVKRMIEVWYNQTYANDHRCTIPYDYIPMPFVAQYFAMTPYNANVMPPPVQNPGVIGRPHISPNSYNARAVPMYAAAAGRPRGPYHQNGY